MRVILSFLKFPNRWVARLALVGSLAAQFGCSSSRSNLPPTASADVQPAGLARQDRPIEESDLLEIKVFNEEGLSSFTRVQAGGTITYPLLGQVEVAGKTAPQVEKLLTDRLGNGFLINPQVTVNVKQYSSRIVSVFGAVLKGGLVLMPEEQRMDIIQAIAQAGGFSQTANRNKIVFTRQGKSTTYTYNKLLKATSGSALKVWLEPGDVIEVKEAVF